MAVFFHCCMSTTCTINRNKGPQSLNRDGKTFEQVNNEFDLKLKRLIENNEEITQIDIIWECQIREKMKNDLNFSNFFLQINATVHQRSQQINSIA